MSGRVRIGTCWSPADAALVRSMFAARGIHAVVGAEHHANLLGPLGCGFLSLDVWVAADEAEEAAALLRDLREGQRCPELSDDCTSPHPIPARIERRRRISLVLLAGCCFTFGTGHLAAGATPRGIALAAVELIGLLQLWAGHAIGLGLVAAAVVADLLGALWIVHRADPTPLPPARIHRS